MRFDVRLDKAEKIVSQRLVDPAIDAELSAWLKSHPPFHFFTQDCEDFPERLTAALQCRMGRMFAAKGMKGHASDLVQLSKEDPEALRCLFG